MLIKHRISLGLVIDAVNRLFCVSNCWSNRAFEAVIASEKLTVGTGDSMHFLACVYTVSNGTIDAQSAKHNAQPGKAKANWY
jgi:hypothetical protein